MTASNSTDMANVRPSDAIMQRAAEWRAKLYTGNSSAEDWAGFADWMDGTPDHAMAYDLVSENEAAFVEYLEKTPAEDAQEDPSHTRWQPWAIAASVALLLVTSLTLIPNLLSPDPTALRLATDPGELREIEIASGLNVTLNGATQLEQAQDDASAFDLVAGEALFVIGPEFASGLSVTVGELTITDRGTVFNISTGRNEHRISVSQGSVELSHANQTFVLEAGQVGIFNVADGSLAVEDFDVATIGSWTDRRLEYTDARIDRVVQDASRILGTQIEQGSCSAQTGFAGTIQLSGNADDDVPLIAGLLGCGAQTTPNGWVLVS